MLSLYNFPGHLTEPAMTKSCLAVLIEPLASGADIFATSSTPRAQGDEDTNEMDVVMGDA